MIITRAWGVTRIVAATLCYLPWAAWGLNPIVARGNMLYDSVTKERFFVRGITYDPTPYAWPGGGGCAAGTARTPSGDAGQDLLADDFCCSEWLGGEDD